MTIPRIQNLIDLDTIAEDARVTAVKINQQFMDALDNDESDTVIADIAEARADAYRTVAEKFAIRLTAYEDFHKGNLTAWKAAKESLEVRQSSGLPAHSEHMTVAEAEKDKNHSGRRQTQARKDSKLFDQIAKNTRDDAETARKRVVDSQSVIANTVDDDDEDLDIGIILADKDEAEAALHEAKESGDDKAILEARAALMAIEIAYAKAMGWEEPKPEPVKKPAPKPTNQTPTMMITGTLDAAFTFFNTRLFGGRLPAPIITVSNAGKRVQGFYANNVWNDDEANDTLDHIALTPAGLSKDPRKALSVLAHEMAHQADYHDGNKIPKHGHGKTWGAIMDDIGLTPSDTGQEGGKRTGSRMDHIIVDGGAYDKAYLAFVEEHGVDGIARFSSALVEADKPDKKARNQAKRVCPSCGNTARTQKDKRLACFDCYEATGEVYEMIVEEPADDPDGDGPKDDPWAGDPIGCSAPKPATKTRRYRTPLPPASRLWELYDCDPNDGILISRRTGGVVGRMDAAGYIAVYIEGKNILAHRIIWTMFNGPIPDGLDIDHINRVRDDNRPANLRPVTHGENMRNRRLGHSLSSDRMGVVKRGDAFVARIGVNGRAHALGTYRIEDDAADAYATAAARVDAGLPPTPEGFKPPRLIDPTSDREGVMKVRGNWTAFIERDKKRVSLGTFKTEAEAIASRVAAEQRVDAGLPPMPDGYVKPSVKHRAKMPGAFKVEGGWMSRITRDGKKHYLGFFLKQEDASAAYLAAKAA